jgi:hypothetical protein
MDPLLLLKILKWAATIIGAAVCIDGIGSVLVKNGQYHALLFDEERYIRAGAGAFLCVLGILALLLT